jgi:integrase
MRGRGSIVERKNGTYSVVIELPPGPEGKRRQRWHKASSKEHAEQLLPELLVQVHRGVYVATNRTTLKDYLLKAWLPGLDVRPSTAQLYETIVNAYVVPHLGSVRLQELAPAHLKALYTTLAKTGRRGGKPLAAKTIRNVHTTLHRALRDAVEEELVVRNVADVVRPPKVEWTAPAHWDAATVAAFVTVTKADRLGPLWITLASTGLRRGEALALRWSDVSLEHGRASVHRSLAWVKGAASFGEPKTNAGRRTVPLPDETVAVLKAHRKRQAAERLAAGELWHDLGLVFALEDGSPIPPGRVTKEFTRAVEAAGLPRLSPHGLRHTWATVALEAGVLTKVVADVLGHSSAQITADLYSHTTEPTTRDASARVALAMFGGG